MSVALGIMLALLNSTMIAIALPDVARDFDSSVSTAGWLVTGYLIAMATIQPAASKIGGRTDLRALFLIGVALFGAVSLGAALAPNLPTLLAFRTLQGVAGAFVTQNGTGLIRHGVDASRRGGGFGLIGGGTVIATVLALPSSVCWWRRLADGRSSP